MVGFVLYDPQDPMQKIVEKVLVGERPKLLVGRNAKGTKTQHRRHVVAYDLLAKSLRKMLKGRRLGDIANWLDDPASWLDSANRRSDLRPCDGTGRVIRSVFGIQGATAGWMKNAANYAENVFNGDKKHNLELSSVYTTGRDLIKESWVGPSVSLLAIELIFCVETSSGRSVRFESAGRFYQAGTEVRSVLIDLWNKGSKDVFFKTEPGMKFVSLPKTKKPEFDYYFTQSGGDLASFVSRNIRMLGHLGGAFRMYQNPDDQLPYLQKVSRDFAWKGLPPSSGVNHNLVRGQEKFLRGGVDIQDDVYQASIDRFERAIKRLRVKGLDGGDVYLFEEAIGGFNRGKYTNAGLFKR